MSDQNQNQNAQIGQIGQGFLTNMQTTVVGYVVCVTKYEIDGDTKGGAIWVSKPTSGRNANIIGDELIKIKIHYDLFDQLKQKQDSKEMVFPGLAEIFAEIDMGGGNKATLTALSVRKYIPEPLKK